MFWLEPSCLGPVLERPSRPCSSNPLLKRPPQSPAVCAPTGRRRAVAPRTYPLPTPKRRSRGCWVGCSSSCTGTISLAFSIRYHTLRRNFIVHSTQPALCQRRERRQREAATRSRSPTSGRRAAHLMRSRRNASRWPHLSQAHVFSAPPAGSGSTGRAPWAGCASSGGGGGGDVVHLPVIPRADLILDENVNSPPSCALRPGLWRAGTLPST